MSVSIYDIDPDRVEQAGFTDIAQQMREMRARGERGIIKVVSIPDVRPECYYFGTYRVSGHYMFDMDMRHVQYYRRNPVPWDRIDGRLNPDTEVQGVANLHHKDGWTAIAFANRTDDNRGGCNSVFFFKADFDFEQAVMAAQEYFPDVVSRFRFAIVNAERYVIR